MTETYEEGAEPEPAAEPGEGEGEEEEAQEEAEGGAEEPGEGTEASEQGSGQAMSTEALKKGLRLLDLEAGRHERRVAEIMGDDFAVLMKCPLCAENIPGYRFAVMPEPDKLNEIRAAIGEPPIPDYQPDTYSRACDTCGGLGAVSTGSKVGGQGIVQCLPCQGRGWLAVGPEREKGMVTVTNGPPPVPVYGQTSTQGNEPPEAAALRELGFIVVAPMPVPGS